MDTLSFWFKLKWLLLNLRRIRYGIIRQPLFTLRLFYKRLGWLLFRRFIGNSIRSPITGELIYNSQSLVTYWAFHCIKELSTEWEYVVRESAAPIVYDVGSNLGLFRNLIMSLNPGARAITIDAWEEMQCYVPIDRHHNIAVGDKEGTSVLNQSKQGLTASTAPFVYKGKSREVRMLPLDLMWDGRDVTILKMDIDGAEFDALRGATAMLDRTKIVIIETSDIALVKHICSGRKWSSVNGIDWIGIQQ